MSQSKAEIIQEAAKKHPVIANPTATGMNVITKDEYTQLAKFVFDQIVTVLSNSYGPYGSMSLINRAGYRFSTKDGWRILMYSLFTNDPYYQAIHRMIFEVCEQMNDTVGDGTTTVILIANRIYDALINVMPEIEKMDLPPREVFKAFDRVVDKVTKKLREKARPFTPEDVRNIALISTNDDESITNCLCELYDRDPKAEIQIMESNQLGVSVENVDGLKIPVMVLDQIYINNAIEKCCDVEEAEYIVFNHKIGEKAITRIVLPLEEQLKKSYPGRRLVVIAPSYEDTMLKGLWLKKAADEYRVTGSCSTVLVHYRSTVLGTSGASDLAILLDTHPVDGRMVDTLIENGKMQVGLSNTNRIALKNFSNATELVTGRCERSKIGYEKMSFFSGLNPTPNVLEAQKLAVKTEIEQLEDTLTVTERATSMKISNLKKRLARLELKMSVIYYGADSTFEKEWLHDTIEDGVRALESARIHGIIRGSQYDLLNALKEHLQDCSAGIEHMITESILVGIQRTLTMDLYSKSQLFKRVLELAKDVVSNHQEIEDLKETDRGSNMITHLGEVLNVTTTGSVSDMDSFNIITMQPDPKLITSAETDICALKASIELLKILVAGNQMLMVQN